VGEFPKKLDQDKENVLKAKLQNMIFHYQGDRSQLFQTGGMLFLSFFIIISFLLLIKKINK